MDRYCNIDRVCESDDRGHLATRARLLSRPFGRRFQAPVREASSPVLWVEVSRLRVVSRQQLWVVICSDLHQYGDVSTEWIACFWGQFYP
jgi:hypothetical protein